MNNASNATIKRHLDWGMVGVIVALCIQGGSMIWWGSAMDRRVSQLEKDVGPVTQASIAIGRMDERTAGITKAVERIERRLDAEEARRR
jgi:hypothetical protein